MSYLGLSLGILGAVILVIFVGSVVWLHIRGFKDGAFHDPILFLTNISLVAYVTTRWDRAKAPTLLALAGVAGLVAMSFLNVLFHSAASVRAFDQGVEAANGKDFDRATMCFTEAIRLDPKYAEAYCNRGRVHGSKGEYDRAIADFTEAARLNPDVADAFYCRGLAYAQKGDLDKAIADLSEAIRLNPKDAEAYHDRGLTYEEKGEKGKADEDFAQAKKLGFNGP